MRSRRAPAVLTAAAFVALAACGGGDQGAVTAAIVVPSAVRTSVVPGGRLSFEGACSGAAEPVTHAWTFPGGTPATDAARVPGVVAFPAAGTYEVGYRCIGADGKASPTVTRTIEVAPAGPSLVRIEPQYLSSAAEQLRPAFDDAVARLSAVVLGPSPGQDDLLPAWDACGDVTVATHAGELRVLVSLEALDGPGGMLASSTPCWIRGGDRLPYVGIVKIDTVDVPFVPAPRLAAAVLHELLHVLGFGTLWEQPGLPRLVADGSGGDPVFTGPNGRAAFRDFDGGDLYGGTPIPLEAAGSAASRGRHWRASVFGDELMDASLGAAYPLSRTTLAALVDLGWQVDAEVADPFTVAATPLAGLVLEPPPPAGLVLEPVGVDFSGDVLPVVPRAR
jgi:hypothetical protein